MDYKKVFSELTPQEFAVLYWKSQGLTHDKVGELLGWGLDNVQKYNSRAHAKLGLGELLQKRREPILENEVYPALREWIRDHTEALNNIRPPEQPQIPPEIETVNGEAVDWETEQRRRWEEEERRRQYEERRKREEETINISPYPALPPGPRRRNWWIIIGATGAFCLCATIGILAIPRLPAINTLLQGVNTPQSTEVNEQTTALPTDTPGPSQTPAPTLTATAESTPVSIPLPVKENFNVQFSGIWSISGDPFVTTSSYYMYDGVLVARRDQNAAIWVANTDWTDYVILTRADATLNNGELTIGFRVKDLNNMIMLECTFRCSWVIIKDGKRDLLVESFSISTTSGLTFRIKGDEINLEGLNAGLLEPITSHLILPQRYKGQFTSGGVYFKFLNTQIDYIEIQPLR
jgi:hypothetical protein